MPAEETPEAQPGPSTSVSSSQFEPELSESLAAAEAAEPLKFTDEAVLAFIGTHPRTTIPAIAEAFGVAKSEVLGRITRLKDNRDIRSVGTENRQAVFVVVGSAADPGLLPNRQFNTRIDPTRRRRLE